MGGGGGGGLVLFLFQLLIGNGSRGNRSAYMVKLLKKLMKMTTREYKDFESVPPPPPGRGPPNRKKNKRNTRTLALNRRLVNGFIS